MAPSKFFLYLTCLLPWNMIMTNGEEEALIVHQDIRFIAADVGQNLSLQCQHEDKALRSYWYMQRIGGNLSAVSISYPLEKTGTFYDDYENHAHFKLETELGRNYLKILDVQVSHTATYFCASSISSMFGFGEGTTILVKDSGLKAYGSVHQSVSGHVNKDFVTLNCTVYNRTCDGEDVVYWFKETNQKPPEIISTQGGSGHRCEKNSDAQTQTCIYSLLLDNPKMFGTYYCVVSSCGHILFGNGTKLHVEGNESNLVFVLSSALTLVLIINASLVFLLRKLYKRKIRQTLDSQVLAQPPENSEDNQDADQYYAEMRVNRSRRQRRKPETECVYSVIKQ